jgi:uncharacterized protein (TIGR03083 family)
MSDPQSWVASTYTDLAARLEGATDGRWDAPSLCERWLVRHVVAHVTMPTRLTPERFAAEMAAARGDFGVLSDAVADRDSALPVADLLGSLRSEQLHAWQPPGGGEAGAVSHAVIHSLDITIALDQAPVAPPQSVENVLDQLTAARGEWFGVDLSGVRLEATDADWAWSHDGDGGGGVRAVRAPAGSLVALLSGRTLPDGQELARRPV